MGNIDYSRLGMSPMGTFQDDSQSQKLLKVLEDANKMRSRANMEKLIKFLKPIMTDQLTPEAKALLAMIVNRMMDSLLETNLNKHITIQIPVSIEQILPDFFLSKILMDEKIINLLKKITGEKK